MSDRQGSWKRQEPRPSTSYAQPQQLFVAVGDNPRDARNRAEKQRRDKLNGAISELAGLVPLVADAGRKIDKTGVLRLTAHELRKEYAFGTPAHCHMDMRPAAASAFAEMMGGFLLTTTCKGIVIVVTPNIEKYLGYSEIDLLGQSIINLTHPDDRKIIREQLLPLSTVVGSNGELVLPDDPDLVKQISGQLQEEKRAFHIRIKRAPQRSEPTTYEMCYINGSLRKADHANSSSSSKAHVVRRARARGYDVISPSGNDILFVGMVHVIKNTFLTEKMMEATKQEYQTRHSIDGKIIECDQRISLVAGYLTSEVAGMNAMTFMHREDVRWVIIALRQMYDSNKAIGESCYRLMSRTGTFIYLKTRGFLEIDSGTNAAKTFICINSLVTEEEGRRLNEEMKRNFSVIIEKDEDSSSDNTVSCNVTGLPIEDPKQLEQVIMHLVTNLPTPSTSTAVQSSSTGHSSPVHSLSIIAPERALIKTAIARSVNLLSETLKMNLERSTNSQSTNKNTSSHLLFSKSESSNKVDELKNTSPGENDEFYNEYNNFINTEDKTSLEAYTSSDANIQNVPEYSLDACDQEFNHMYTNGSIPGNSDAGLCEIIPDIPVTSNTPCNGIEVGIPAYTSFASNITTNTIMDQVLTTASIDLTDDSIEFTPNNATTEPSTSTNCANNKRTSHDALGEQYNTGSCKRKLQMHSEDNDETYTNEEQLDDYGDNHNPNEYDSEYQFTNNENGEQDGFETFIEQLINPSSELCEVVPRSLAALESTITHMDGTMHILNARRQEFQEELSTEQHNNLNEMMIEHQEHKQILESIQYDHLTQTDEATPPAT